MAKIIVSAYSNVTWTKEQYHDSFVEGFIRALRRCGNDVLAFNLRNINEEQFGNSLRKDLIKEKVYKSIKEFSPDLIISFNNSLPGDQILEITDCPVAVYSADVPMLYASRDMIKSKIERYYFLNTTHIIEAAVRDVFKPRDDHMFLFGQATDMRKMDIPQTKDIMYIGSLPNYSGTIINYFVAVDGNIEDSEQKNKIKNNFFKAFDEMKETDFTTDIMFDFPGWSVKPKMSNWAQYNAVCLAACTKKFAILSELTEFDLEIHGYPWNWPHAMQYNYELFRCFDYNLSVTLEQNCKNFNKSKLALNLPNATEKEGFSWRVADILATNAVLLTKKSKTLEEMFYGYIDFPMYESASDAKVLARKLLNDKNWRDELVLASNQMIEDKCRFESKFRDMESMLGLSLINENGNGTMADFVPEYKKPSVWYRAYKLMGRIYALPLSLMQKK